MCEKSAACTSRFAGSLTSVVFIPPGRSGRRSARSASAARRVSGAFMLPSFASGMLRWLVCKVMCLQKCGSTARVECCFEICQALATIVREEGAIQADKRRASAHDCTLHGLRAPSADAASRLSRTYRQHLTERQKSSCPRALVRAVHCVHLTAVLPRSPAYVHMGLRTPRSFQYFSLIAH